MRVGRVVDEGTGVRETKEQDLWLLVGCFKELGFYYFLKWVGEPENQVAWVASY